MSGRIFFAAVMGLMVLVSMSQGQEVAVQYQLTNMGADLWTCHYTVSNISLGQDIREFTIYFDYGKYRNLARVTGSPLNSQWSEMVMPQDDVLDQGPIYDALNVNSAMAIVPGASLGGFTVQFNYMGDGVPGSQYFEIVDPTTYETVADGVTIPEPGMLSLLAIGGVLVRRRG